MLNNPLLSKVLVLETHAIDFASNKRAQFLRAIVRLSYTRYSWRLIRLMIQVSPKSTAIIILGRFIQGLLPSIDLHIKGQFLDIVENPGHQANLGTSSGREEIL
jgi:hypothetical protein